MEQEKQEEPKKEQEDEQEEQEELQQLIDMMVKIADDFEDVKDYPVEIQEGEFFLLTTVDGSIAWDRQQRPQEQEEPQQQSNGEQEEPQQQSNEEQEEPQQQSNDEAGIVNELQEGERQQRRQNQN